MKKMLCMILALVMALSLTVPSLAATTETKGDGKALSTAVTYAAADTETWTVTVPETLTADGATGNVSATGYWNSKKILVVYASGTVTMTSKTYTDKYTATITMTGEFAPNGNLAITGDNDSQSSGSATIKATFNGTKPLFGKDWTGTITYEVVCAEPQQGGDND